ncbi:MAG: hypothetical protein ACOC95_08725 [Planctomycetota bacterium]
MARVVQRSGPPYLTILFVFLFFIAAGVAGWLGTVAQNRGKEVAKLQDTVDTLGRSMELNDPAMAALKARAAKERRTVIGQMRADQQALIDGLVGSSAGQGTSAEQALAQIEAAHEAFGKSNPEDQTTEGVLTILDQVGAELMSARRRVASLEDRTGELAADLKKSRADAADAQEILAGQLEQTKADLADLQTKLDELSKSYEQRVAAANSDWEGRVSDLQDDLSTRDREIRNLESRVRDLLARVDELEDRVRGERRGPEAELKADGRILEVVPEHNLVYISLGRRDNIRVGLPFSVYAKQTGVSAEGESKGRIIVKSVDDAIAECHVVRTTPGEPIVAGDLIANIAFSTVTQPTFYIVGQFDLNNDGESDDDSLDAIRNMIARFGGSIVDEISVQTDYVVMGAPPRPVARPAPDAPPTHVALWERHEKQVAAYENTQEIAMRFNKPILNARQFMSFIGYTPEVLEP